MQTRLLLCLTSALLAGCAQPFGSAQNQTAQPVGLAFGDVATKETLSGSKVHAHCHKSSSGSNSTFKAQGIASGRYAGHFTASGTWTTISGASPTWTFDQKFKIVTKAETLKGTITGSGSGTQNCNDFGANGLTFTLASKSGQASAFVTKGDLGEILHNP